MNESIVFNVISTLIEFEIFFGIKIHLGEMYLNMDSYHSIGCIRSLV